MKRHFRNICLIILLWVPLLGGSSFAQAQESLEDSPITYRSIIYFFPDAKIPTETDLSKYLTEFERIESPPELITKPYARFGLTDDFQEDLPVPGLDYLAYSGRGLSKSQADDIQGVKQILILDVIYPAAMFLDGYEPVMDALHNIATSHRGLIWDSETRELFSPDAWAERRLAAYEGAVPNITNHFTIHAYNTDENGNGAIRAITLGLRKFGLPDIVVNDFSWSSNQGIGNLINLTAQTIFEGANITDDDKLILNVSKIKNGELRDSFREGLSENAVPQLEIGFDQAQAEEGDPDNLIMELRFDDFEGETLSEKHDTALSALFGWEDNFSLVEHNEEILAASQRAKAKLDGFRKEFEKGLPPGDFISLKAPFETPDGENEWMWVEVTSWSGKNVTGLLQNQPYFIPDLQAGAIVNINQDDVFDYIRDFADGRSEGNETGAIMSRQK